MVFGFDDTIGSRAFAGDVAIGISCGELDLVGEAREKDEKISQVYELAFVVLHGDKVTGGLLEEDIL